MVEFLNSEKVLSEIADIIDNAKGELVLLSPFNKIPERLFERLKNADERNVRITLVYGKDELKDGVQIQLKQIKNLKLYFAKNLHAKCYYNEEAAVITSMNLHDYSAQNNWEMGILIRKKEDSQVYIDALREASSIIRRSEVISQSNIVKGAVKEIFKSLSSSIFEQNKGYCIRCQKRIPYDLDHPMCAECFSKWKEHNNPNYKEHYCHTCGKAIAVTKIKPQCLSCYKDTE